MSNLRVRDPDVFPERVVSRYPIAGAGRFILDLPQGAEVLAVQMSSSEGPVLLVHEDSAGYDEERHFLVVSTGERFEDVGYRWVGTYELENGRLVLHVFERRVGGNG